MEISLKNLFAFLVFFSMFNCSFIQSDNVLAHSLAQFPLLSSCFVECYELQSDLVDLM